MTVSKYALLDQDNACVNIVLWDGDTTKWTPAPYVAVAYDPAVHVVNQPPVVVNQQSLVTKATTALANNVAYLGIASPTNAQVVAQVAALTREVNAIIRLVTQTLDSTTGT